MNLGGFAPTASIRIFKTFIRPSYEYGQALCCYNGQALDRIQKIQNLALRTIVSAARNTSTDGLHKLLRIPKVKFRNQELAARFCASLHNNKCRKIPAVRLWWNGIQSQDVPRTSLIHHMTSKNPLWNQQRKISHLQNRLSNEPSLVLPPSTPEQRHLWNATHITNLNTDKSTIAGAILCEINDDYRAILKPGIVDLRQKMAIIKWILGGVATHQRTCQVCNRELSRSHAIDCADVYTVLLPKYERLWNPQSPLNIIDQLLNHHRHSTDTRFYSDIFTCISQIYRRCLGYRQQANGHFQADHTANPPNPRNQPQAEPALGQWNRPLRPNQPANPDHQRRPLLPQVIPRRRNRREAELENNEGNQGQRWQPP
jgi:hypothetical protein